VLAIGLGGAGCGQRDEPIRELLQPYPVTVQGSGEQPTSVESMPQRIVALDPGSAELIDALGVGDRLVGVPGGVKLASGRTPAEVVKPTGRIDVNRVVRLEPDLIVVTPDTDPVELSQIERRTGAVVYVQPSRSIEDVERATLELGFLLGKPVTARQLAGSIKESVAETERRLANVEAVTTFVDRGFFITVADRSLLGDLIDRAQGENVAGDYAGLGPFPVARLRRADPDVYLATSEADVTLESLRKDPQTRRLTAVQDGRVLVVPDDLVTRAGPRVAQALETVAASLHPDAFR
jgi:iron complex transport system substrate-binding protein